MKKCTIIGLALLLALAGVCQWSLPVIAAEDSTEESAAEAALKAKLREAYNQKPASTGTFYKIPPALEAKMKSNLTTQAKTPPAAAPAATNAPAPAPIAAQSPAAVTNRPATVPRRVPAPRPTTNTAVVAPSVAPTATNTAPVVAAPAAAPSTSEVAAPADAAPVAATRAVSTATAGTENDLIDAQLLNLKGMTLAPFLEIYQDLTGKVVLAAPNLANPQFFYKPPANMKQITRGEVLQAMDALLAFHNIVVVPLGDKLLRAVPSVGVNTEGVEFTDGDASLPEANRYVTQVVQLKHLSTQDVLPILSQFSKIPNGIVAVESSKILYLRDYAVNIKRMLEVLEKIDVVAPLTYESEVIQIKYALATDMQAVLGALTPSGASIVVGTSRGSGGGGAITGGNRNTGSRGNFGSRGNQGSGFNSQFGGGGGGFGAFSSDDIKPLQVTPGVTPGNRVAIQNQYANIVRGAQANGEFQILGETKIIADERTNSLLVFAAKKDMTEIKKIVEKIDVVLAQVVIDAIILEVTLSDTFDLGISASQNSRTKGSYTGAGAIQNGPAFLNPTNLLSLSNFGSGSGLNYFGSIGDDFDFALNAAATDSRVKVLSRPRIQTSHNAPASLRVGDEVPYITGTFSGLNGNPQSQYSPRFIGIQLDVTPLINPDGLVVLTINQTVQQLGEDRIIDNNRVPTATTRDAQAEVAVRNGESVMLGGFITNTRTDSRSGVPYLKDIPGLGALFRRTGSSDRRVELIVLIRPTVLATPADAAVYAQEQREALPAVRQAEAEFKKQEDKARRKAPKVEDTSREDFRREGILN